MSSTSTARTRQPPAVHQLLSRLQREWDRLARSPEALARARSWSLPVTDFESLDDLLRLAGLGASGTGRCGDDELLAALVVEARRDELAARVLLQRLLPGVATIVRRHTGFVAQLDATDELLAARPPLATSLLLFFNPSFELASARRSFCSFPSACS